MYLKSLTLKGFKSFADRSVLLLEPGLTVIVGPNGSGKSNVSDAILWVLGEQSAKQLRGAAMEDVVFAGSSARKPVSVAEVALVLDNSDHMLPVDFDEVALTRRMYRSGESEYLINGSPARLLDFTDILHDSGLGKDTHSIISQGKLDAILMSRPEERRALIEEAAGISKHKRRRARAERKLASMDANLSRALDVQREVVKRLKPLERQVVRAKRYNEVTARLSELRRILAVDDLRRLRQRWERAEADEREAAAELEVADYRVRQTGEELDRLNGMLEERGLFVGDLSEQRRKFESALERLAAGRRLLDEKARAMHARRSELSTAAARAKARKGELADELSAAEQERDANRGECSALQERMSAAKARLREAKAARREAEDALGKANARIRACQRAATDAAVALSKARAELDNARVQDDLFSSRLNQLDVDLAQSQAQADDAAARVERQRADLERARADEASAREAADAAREAHAAAQGAESAARRELADAEARLAGLRKASRSDSNAAPLAARLDGRDEFSREVRGRVAELLDVPAQLAPLVESVLAGRLAGFVVDGRDALGRLSAVAQGVAGGSAGQVHFVDASHGARSHPAHDGARPLSASVRAADGLEGLVDELLGDVYIVGSPAEALSASAEDPHGRYVTADGLLVAHGGTVEVGRAHDVQEGVLERQRQIRSLEASIPQLTRDHELAQAAAARADEAMAQARDALNERVAATARLAGEVASSVNEAARLKSAIDRSRAERDKVARQREDASARARAASESVARLDERRKGADDDLACANDEAAGLQERFDAARREDSSAHNEVNDCDVRLARAQGKTGGLEARVERLAREAAQLEASSAKSFEQLSALEVRCDRIDPLRAAFDAALAAAGEKLDLVRDRARIAEADSATLKATIETARAASAAANKAYADALNRTGEVKVEKGRLDVQVDEAVKAITSQRGVVLEEALQLPAPVDRAADEAEMASLEEALAGIGPVNQVAMEEYDELKGRADYISEQVEDLQHARRDLTKILNVIDKKMRASFLETFDAVKQNFEEIFTMLFPGGKGTIEMTDPESPEDCGIEVVAQPRGKRVTKMSLLSGGERSLTALGLLFAVYRTRTVPFYVLDEVEAALDDSNLDRLLAAIDVLRDSTQLIVISHQRRTMERADVLYGVSMQADGVSRVVSQKLDGRGNVVDA